MFNTDTDIVIALDCNCYSISVTVLVCGQYTVTVLQTYYSFTDMFVIFIANSETDLADFRYIKTLRNILYKA